MTGHAARIIFFGMRCPFSEIVLRGLISGGLAVQAVVLPAPGSPLPLTLHWPPEPNRRLPMAGGGIDGLAAGAGIPVAAIPSAKHRKVRGWLAAREPDLFVVACFPWRLPHQLRELARVAAINVHPSLLPALRGPDPLFWTFRLGIRQTGVTIHLLTDEFDAGPVVARDAIEVPDGIRERELEAQLADRGGRLLIGVLPDLLTGTADVQAQDDRAASSAPLPAPADFLVPTNLPARWACNFVRGVAARQEPLQVLVMESGERLRIRDALGWASGAAMGRPVVGDGETRVVQFEAGTVTFLVAPDVQQRGR